MSTEVVRGRRPMDNLMGLIAFGILGALWIAFGVAIVIGQGSLDDAWRWLQSLPLVAQVIVWVLLLPVTAGLWVWETTWPFIVRLVVVGGLAFATLYTFFPKFLLGAKVAPAWGCRCGCAAKPARAERSAAQPASWHSRARGRRVASLSASGCAARLCGVAGRAARSRPCWRSGRRQRRAGCLRPR